MTDWRQFVRERLPEMQLGGAREAEVCEELAQQLEQCYDEARARGATDEEAQADAEAQFPRWAELATAIRVARQPIAARLPEPLRRELQREDPPRWLRSGKGKIMGDLWMDLRYGLRSLRKSAGFAIAAVLTLALGIGANTAVFSVVRSVLLRPLPYAEPERLVLMWETYKLTQDKSVSYPNYMDWKAQSRAFASVGAYNTVTMNLTGGDEPERLLASLVSGSLFETLGVRPLLGRTYSPDEDQPGGVPVIVISHGLWERRFGGDASVIGKGMTLDGRAFTIIGVMPRTFLFPSSQIAVWAPLSQLLELDDRENRNDRAGTMVVGRLREGTALAQARAEMDALSSHLAQQFPASNKDHSVVLRPLHGTYVESIRSTLITLLAAVGFVLLIACANISSLLLARNWARLPEMAVRRALGAGYGRIARQLFAENLLLALLGGVAGLGLMTWAMRFVPALLPAGVLQRVGPIEIDAVVLAFTFAITLLAALVFGVAPVLHASRGQLSGSLRESRSAGPGRSRLQSVLVCAEVALTLILLIGAGLMLGSLARLRASDPGFDARNVLTFEVAPSGERYPDRAAITLFFEQLTARLKSLPRVESAAAILPLPLGDVGFQTQLTFPDSPAVLPEESVRVDYARVTPEYFSAMRIPLLDGRAFTETDREGTPLVALVDETLARQYFPGQRAVGRRIRRTSNKTELEIVGVVRHVKNYGVQRESRYEMFLPVAQSGPPGRMTVVIRVAGDAAGMAAAARAEVRALDAVQPVYNVRTMQDLLDRSIASERFGLILLAVFAGLALLLATVGLYGVLAFIVRQRTREIGIRMALGACPAEVARMVAGYGLKLAAAGAVFGLAGALALSRFLASLLYGVAPNDPVVFGSVAALMIAVATLACLHPAIRAARVDPMTALRHE